ncbi:hypothetical protein CATYP_02645 [Corynebacterium atypicum]|uniref:biotin--[biotin carboxyl-carrier protein] ligase n=1 Tax=Corynebacterium atypicum TaxID=191610 RepID=A0ABM5QM14_9CORY|nr:biotin--[acetyl-CoA-carboxylase] ligase [Corynebacterium atypicum]AIG63761.1 hypothetical protein CATYP_02645 [Corynebacterium atypicum]
MNVDIAHLRERLGNAYALVDYVAQTGSTNADLLARGELLDKTVLIAGHQTAGRGRMGRSFTAPEGTQLIFSVGLRPGPEELERLGVLPLAAGLAVTDAIPDTQLKWPNDVLMAGGKVCGILCEADGLGGQTSPRVVLGCGLNVSFSADEAPVDTATSLAIEGSPLATVGMEELAARVLGALARRLEQWQSADDRLIAEYRMASATLGQAVRVATPSGELEGIAEDVASDGQLVMITEDNQHRLLSAGDVTHLRLWCPSTEV